MVVFSTTLFRHPTSRPYMRGITSLFKVFYFSLYVCIFCLHICICITCMLSAHRAQKMMLELEQQTLGSCKVDAGNIPGPLQRAASALHCWAFPPASELQQSFASVQERKGHTILLQPFSSHAQSSCNKSYTKRFIQIINHHILF